MTCCGQRMVMTMPDVMTPEQRHRCMQHIRGKETKPEVLARKWLFHHGIRYRKNDKKLPGTPDIVIPNGKVVVFVNGCFWHGHTGCKDFVIPKTRTDWWINKITTTQHRDKEKSTLLEEAGWKVIILWECEVKRNFETRMEEILSDIIARRRCM